MPRTAIAPVTVPGSTQYTGTVVTPAAADTTNQNSAIFTGKELIIAENTDVAAHTVTVTSVVDSFGRTKDIAAVSLAAGEWRVFGPFDLTGWQQTDGLLYFEANHVGVEFVVLKLLK